MEMPETYRAKAKQYLRDAENSSGIMRIHFILLAQRWFELADFFNPYWGSDVEHDAKQSGKSDISSPNARNGDKELPVSPIGRS